MRSARGAKGQSAPARNVLVKRVWKDASSFLSLLNASRESAVTAGTANLPVHGFYFAAAGQVQSVRPPTLSSYSGRALEPRVLFPPRANRYV